MVQAEDAIYTLPNAESCMPAAMSYLLCKRLTNEGESGLLPNTDTGHKVSKSSILAKHSAVMILVNVHQSSNPNTQPIAMHNTTITGTNIYNKF